MYNKTGKDMKPNQLFSTICIVFSMGLFFCCGHREPNTALKETEGDSLEIEEEKIYEDEIIKGIIAINFPVDSLDIKLDYEPKKGFKDYFLLSEEDFNTARQIVKDYFQKITVDEEPDSDNPFPYNHYFKQYVGYHDPDTGKDVIEVNLFTSEMTHHGWVGELKNIWLGMTEDGGKTVGRIIIDMKQKRVISFSLNGR